MLTCDMRECNLPVEEQNMQAYAFMSIIVGLGAITQKNYKQWYARYMIAESLNGPYFDNGAKLTLLDVKKHIGMKANVSDETDSEFLKRTQKIFFDISCTEEDK